KSKRRARPKRNERPFQRAKPPTPVAALQPEVSIFDADASYGGVISSRQGARNPVEAGGVGKAGGARGRRRPVSRSASEPFLAWDLCPPAEQPCSARGTRRMRREAIPSRPSPAWAAPGAAGSGHGG